PFGAIWAHQLSDKRTPNVKARTRTRSPRRRPTTARCQTCDGLSRTAITILRPAAGGGRRQYASCPSPPRSPGQYFISGEARMTVFASQNNARTFDFQAGDVGYVPFPMGHYVENIGTTTLRFLEIFRSDYYADVSLAQWLAFTPRELVKAH